MFPAVPIVGLPCQEKGWFITILVMCTCKTPEPILLVGIPGAAQNACKGCGRVFRLVGMNIVDLQTEFKFEYRDPPKVNT